MNQLSNPIKFDKQEHRKNLIKWTQAKCVTFSYVSAHDLNEMLVWCQKNLGERRLWHPIYEALEGWLDYFDGEWAYTDRDHNDDISFWFSDPAQQALFILTWKK